MTRKTAKTAAAAPADADAGPAASAAEGRQTIVLPPVLDLPHAAELYAWLSECRGGAVTLDAARVDRVGALGQQVLVAAARAWAAADLGFAIVAPSPGFSDSARALGLDFAPFHEGAPT